MKIDSTRDGIKWAILVMLIINLAFMLYLRLN